MGVVDTKEYFASVDPVVLAEQLLHAGCPPGAVHGLRTILQATADVTGVAGLPIGCEASAFLGNVYLAPGDTLFAQHGVPHRRWTDDVWAFPANESTWDEVLAEYRASSAQLGLKLNDDKTRFLGRADALATIQNPVVDYLLTIVGGGNISPDQAADQLAWMLAMESFGEPIDPTALRFCLGVLNSRCAPDGVRIIQAYPDLFDREPTAVGRYLVTIARDQTTQRELDIEWLAELAVRTPTGRTVAGSVQALRVLSHLHLPASVGNALLEVSTDRSRADQVPLQEWAAWAWHRSEAWKPRIAAEAAEATGHLSTKRAFTAGLHRGSGSASVRKCLDRLARQEPELAPTIAWAR
jgi:hypothetical protein